MTSFQATLPGKPDQMSPIRAAVPITKAASSLSYAGGEVREHVC